MDLHKQNLKLYWKDDKGENIKNFKRLDDWLQSKSEKLVFAMNGGMYLKDYAPQGLYIEDGEEKKRVNVYQRDYGNFYMVPNGIFYITENHEGFVCTTQDFRNEHILYATQSGPMLLIDGKRHPKFTAGSKNTNIRNGVGVLPDGRLLFAMSKKKICFYDFASFFKSQGCKNALYLDGFVSRTYWPEQGWSATEGDFGVIIGESVKM